MMIKKKLINILKSKQVWGLVVLFIVAMGYFRNVSFTTTGDDEVYRTSLEVWGSIFKWAKAYYYGNSGRIIIHALLIGLLNLPVSVFKIVSSLMVVLTGYCIYCMINTGKNDASNKMFVLVMICFSLCFFTIPGLGGIIRWASGALNYLYPVCCMIIVLIPFYRALHSIAVRTAWKIISLMAVFVCGNMEQSAAVVLAISLLVGLYMVLNRREEPYKVNDIIFLIVLGILNIAILLFSYTAPGVTERYKAELIRCCGYSMFSLPQKIVLGIQIFTMYLFSFRALFIWLFPTLGCLTVFIRRQEKQNIALCFINIIACGIQNVLIRKVFDIQFYHPYDKAYNVWLIFTCLLIFFSGFLIITALSSDIDKYWYGFIFLGAFAAGVVPAFSPTLFVSAGRTMYIAYILLIIVGLKVLSEGFFSSICVRQPDEQQDSCIKLYLKRGYIFLAGVITSMVVLSFIMDYHLVDQVDISTYSLVDTDITSECQLNMQTGVIEGKVGINEFKYTVNNWCQGMIDGYDFNIQVGILNVDSGYVKKYETVLRTTYPVMEEYDNNEVSFVGYYKKDIVLQDGEKMVLLFEHDGRSYYQFISL